MFRKRIKIESVKLSTLIMIACFIATISAGLNERHLINHLLADYNPLERPVENENDTLNVILGISLQQIIEVDEKNQILISNLWLKLQWTDVNLRWNPEDYGGIETLRISTDRIWIPDVLMYNSADERFDSTFRTNVVVNYTGGCLYVPPGIFKSTCQIDITWFPFDDQRCELKFGSWSHNGLLVDLIQENSSADVSPYLANGEWVLVDVPSIRTSKFYECCPGPFVDIKFIIHIKRRTLYYGFNLIIPCIILSSMTLLSFSLPPESGEKLQLGVTILLSMTVFLVQLSKILPATSDSISIIALYFGSIMIMVAVSVVMTVVVLNFHHRSYETKEMGPKIRKFLLDWLPRLLQMDRPGIKPPKKCLKKVPSEKKLAKILDCKQAIETLTFETNDESSQSKDFVSEDLENSSNSISIAQQIDPFNYGLSVEESILPPPISIVSQRNQLDGKNFGYSVNQSSQSLNKYQQLDGGSFRSSTDEDQDFKHETDCILDSHSNNNRIDQVDSDRIEPITTSIGYKERETKFESKLKDKYLVHDSHHSTEDHLFCIKKQCLLLKRRYKLLEILIEMRFITDRLRREDQIKETISEWRYGATVLDRLCLILFALFTLLSLAVCLISAPQLIV
ncbi:hypothetical protein NH340_JMT02338 [Sarcoptes scabiei]|nr:hypothetical protein NH340_JMT02338 [Sarcoptes scabiei]